MPADDRSANPLISFDPALRDRIAANLAVHDRHAVAADGRKSAAVAIVVVSSEPDEPPAANAEPSDAELSVSELPDGEFDPRLHGASGGAAFLLCRRAARMGRHAGQWALPGGRIDTGETAVAAALRELHEEVGLLRTADDVIGVLDDYPTRSGYVITPVVVWGGDEVELVENRAEVARTYRVGLHELCREDSPRFFSIPESDRPVVQLPLGAGVLVHAPTAAVLVQFRWVGLDGRANARVHEFEQPVFAWR